MLGRTKNPLDEREGSTRRVTGDEVMDLGQIVAGRLGPPYRRHSADWALISSAEKVRPSTRASSAAASFSLK